MSRHLPVISYSVLLIALIAFGVWKSMEIINRPAPPVENQASAEPFRDVDSQEAAQMAANTEEAALLQAALDTPEAVLTATPAAQASPSVVPDAPAVPVAHEDFAPAPAAQTEKASASEAPQHVVLNRMVEHANALKRSDAEIEAWRERAGEFHRSHLPSAPPGRE